MGSDGIDDGKIYVLKPINTSQDSNESEENNNSITPEQAANAKSYIKENDKKSEKFNNGSFDYTPFIEIEGATNRKKMVEIVSKDNGKGGNKDANNREYGGYIKDGSVVESPAGPVCNPMLDKYASILLPSENYSTFHSHPSGDVIKRDYNQDPNKLGGAQKTTTYYFEQQPSNLDLNNAGGSIHYVFGRADKVVYIYNKSGILAKLKINEFIK